MSVLFLIEQKKFTKLTIGNAYENFPDIDTYVLCQLYSELFKPKLSDSHLSKESFCTSMTCHLIFCFRFL